MDDYGGLQGRLIVVTAEQIIELFGMKPLPEEGGFYVETYRCACAIKQAHLPAGYEGDRSLGSAILYLLTPQTLSRLHRLRSDELFHFYLGDPVTMLQLHPDGASRVITLGHDLRAGQQVQAMVPAGCWQGCLLNDGGRYALMGTTVVPGFEFADFEAADREQLLRRYPSAKELVIRLTAGAGCRGRE